MIGILGGTFNPIHYGHLRSAIEVKEIFSLEQVRLIPCANPPHREQPDVSALARTQMVALAISNQPGLICDTREIDRYHASYSPSYMVDTLRSLRKDFQNQALLLLIGSDAFNALTGWHCWRQLFDHGHIVVMTRPGFIARGLDEFFRARQASHPSELKQVNAGKLFFQPVTQLDISATTIRNIIAKKQNPSFLLPDAVIEYIKQNKLYEQQ